MTMPTPLARARGRGQQGELLPIEVDELPVFLAHHQRRVLSPQHLARPQVGHGGEAGLAVEARLPAQQHGERQRCQRQQGHTKSHQATALDDRAMLGRIDVGGQVAPVVERADALQRQAQAPGHQPPAEIGSRHQCQHQQHQHAPA